MGQSEVRSGLWEGAVVYTSNVCLSEYPTSRRPRWLLASTGLGIGCKFRARKQTCVTAKAVRTTQVVVSPVQWAFLNLWSVGSICYCLKCNKWSNLAYHGMFFIVCLYYVLLQRVHGVYVTGSINTFLQQ